MTNLPPDDDIADYPGIKTVLPEPLTFHDINDIMTAVLARLKIEPVCVICKKRFLPGELNMDNLGVVCEACTVTLKHEREVKGIWREREKEGKL